MRLGRRGEVVIRNEPWTLGERNRIDISDRQRCLLKSLFNHSWLRNAYDISGPDRERPGQRKVRFTIA